MKRWLNKQTITSFILGALLFLTIPAFAESRIINALYNNIRLKINGVFIKTDVEPFIVDGRTMVPARFVAESLGATVRFNDDENCVDIVSTNPEQNSINYTNGDKYIGEIKNDLPNGKGVYYWPDGAYYVGQFADGLFQDLGYVVEANGNIFFGNWINGKQNGYGYFVKPGEAIYFLELNQGKTVNTIQLQSLNQSVSNSVGSIAASIDYPLYLYSDENKRVYLGKLATNEYDSDSIYNKYGTYGSKYNSLSIWNEYGTYGSKYSSCSAFNNYASNPPIIIDSSGTIVGRLTTNKYITGAIDPNTLYKLLTDLGQ